MHTQLFCRVSQELWLPGVPDLKLRVYQFDALLAQHLPRLHRHFKAMSLQLEVRSCLYL
jgi:hypothetical protein